MNDQPAVFVTTSAGVYLLDENFPDSPKKVLGLAPNCKKIEFPKGGLGFFGVSVSDKKGHIFLAERNKNKKWQFWKSDRTILYLFNVRSFEVADFWSVPFCADVHQIAYLEGRVYLTDTARNRVVIVNSNTGEFVGAINIGNKRKDLNHINAISVSKDIILINLNNRGEKFSEIVRIPNNGFNFYSQNILDNTTEKICLTGITHTHDIEVKDGIVWSSASKDGYIFSVNDLEPFARLDGWVRGIAFSRESAYVGVSRKANRAERHKNALSGFVEKYDLKSKNKVQSFTIPECGQVNDIHVL